MPLCVAVNGRFAEAAKAWYTVDVMRIGKLTKRDTMGMSPEELSR